MADSMKRPAPRMRVYGAGLARNGLRPQSTFSPTSYHQMKLVREATQQRAARANRERTLEGSKASFSATFTKKKKTKNP